MTADSVAIVDLKRCSPHKCNYECANNCPPNRAGEDCIIKREDAEEPEKLAGAPEQVRISEQICLGEKCGICVKKCPFDAIKIINLPAELEEDPIHRFGENMFRLYGLPAPEEGKVTGVLGPNGIGKTTAVKILTGEIEPNLGSYRSSPGLDEVISKHRGTALQDHLKRLDEGEMDVAWKPEAVDLIPRRFEGAVGGLLESADQRGVVDDLLEDFSMGAIKDQEISTLSGGELQRAALISTLSREADIYIFDEVTPYLDIKQRMTAARTIRDFAEEDRTVLVVEHDLAVLDMIADSLHISYGEPGVYGIVTQPKSTRTGINQYLEGFLENENMRIREESIKFEEHAPRTGEDREMMVKFPRLKKSYVDSNFNLEVEEGDLRLKEVVGVLGPNGIGKSTFADLIAGELEPDEGDVDTSLEISYKPQHVELNGNSDVKTYLRERAEDFGSSYWDTEISRPLDLEELMDKDIETLSGGERQRVSVAACLSREADLYLLDEPSAHLDVEQRVGAARAIRKNAERRSLPTLVIDHDAYMIDLIADRLQVFEGIPNERGRASPPKGMEEGMNHFLKNLEITFRRDQDTGRPRINKPGSRKDREQKKKNEYYYR